MPTLKLERKFKGFCLNSLKGLSAMRKIELKKEGEAEVLPATMAEGIAGTWHYHVSDNGGRRGLCNKPTMHSEAPLNTWGFKPEHMPSSYCIECATVAAARGIKLG